VALTQNLRRMAMNQDPASESDSSVINDKAATQKPIGMRKPDVLKMGYNPANFAHWIGEEPWVPGYRAVRVQCEARIV